MIISCSCEKITNVAGNKVDNVNVAGANADDDVCLCSVWYVCINVIIKCVYVCIN